VLRGGLDVLEDAGRLTDVVNASASPVDVLRHLPAINKQITKIKMRNSKFELAKQP
jgi:hypothetical protein